MDRTVLRSENGTDWFLQLNAPGAIFWSAAYGNGTFVAGGLYGVAYRPDFFVAVGENGFIVRSRTGEDSVHFLANVMIEKSD